MEWTTVVFRIAEFFRLGGFLCATAFGLIGFAIAGEGGAGAGVITGLIFGKILWHYLFGKNLSAANRVIDNVIEMQQKKLARLEAKGKATESDYEEAEETIERVRRDELARCRGRLNKDRDDI